MNCLFPNILSCSRAKKQTETRITLGKSFKVTHPNSKSSNSGPKGDAVTTDRVVVDDSDDDDIIYVRVAKVSPSTMSSANKISEGTKKKKGNKCSAGTRVVELCTILISMSKLVYVLLNKDLKIFS